MFIGCSELSSVASRVEEWSVTGEEFRHLLRESCQQRHLQNEWRRESKKYKLWSWPPLSHNKHCIYIFLSINCQNINSVVGFIKSSLCFYSLQGMILTLPGKSQGGVVHQHLATLSMDSTKLCVTSYSCSAGAGIFMCKHDNPHHFHMYKFHKF